MHQKLAYETIFSYTFCDWFNIWADSHFDQSACSSHKLITCLYQIVHYGWLCPSFLSMLLVKKIPSLNHYTVEATIIVRCFTVKLICRDHLCFLLKKIWRTVLPNENGMTCNINQYLVMLLQHYSGVWELLFSADFTFFFQNIHGLKFLLLLFSTHSLHFYHKVHVVFPLFLSNFLSFVKCSLTSLTITLQKWCY